MTNAPVFTTANIGDSIWQQLKDALDTKPVKEFDDLLDLKDLAGTSTGTIEVLTANNLIKMSALSIVMGPGRYFNIHVIPEADVRVPRFVFEGMAMPGGSQVSMDLFPDTDIFMDIKPWLDQYADAIAVYNKARMESGILFEASRQAHMRAFSSPLFLCAFGISDENLTDIESFARGYLESWLKMYHAAPSVDLAMAEARIKRRAHMQNSIIALDPDRDRVVKIYGEATTRAIERASML